MSTSGMPTPMACARIRTSPALGSGMGTSRHSSTPGGPGSRNRMSFMIDAPGSAVSASRHLFLKDGYSEYLTSYGLLVWRFRSPHHSFRESEMRTSEPKPH